MILIIIHQMMKNFLSQEEEYEDDTEIIPVKQAWKESLDIIQDDTVLENDNNDTIRLIKDSLRDVVMDRVMRRLQEENRDEEEEEDTTESNNENDIEYYKKDDYYKNMTEEEKEIIEKAEEEIKKFNKEVKPVEFDVLSMNTTIANKSYMMNRLKTFRKMESNDHEYEKLLKMG